MFSVKQTILYFLPIDLTETILTKNCLMKVNGKVNCKISLKTHTI